MNGYSKLQVIQNTETISTMGYSDLEPKAISDTSNVETPESNHQIKAPNPSRGSPAAEQEGVDQEGPQTNGPNLRRNSSAASPYALQAAVKKAFSMTRSTSVCDRYCRIHDRSVSVTSPPLDDEREMGTTRGSQTKRSSRGKILKAWKKLFGI